MLPPPWTGPDPPICVNVVRLLLGRRSGESSSDSIHNSQLPVRERSLVQRVTAQRLTLSMRALGGEVALGRWGKSAAGRGLSEPLAVDDVAVLRCCTGQ